jgi:hypothetical protein
MSGPLSAHERRVHLDLCVIKARPLEKNKPAPLLPKPNWLIVVDETTTCKFSEFFGTKKEIEEFCCELFKKWSQQGITVTHVRMDGAGENRTLQKRAESVDWQLGIRFEYTARDSPQQNSLAKVGFATLTNRTRAVVYRANVPSKWKHKVYKAAALHVTDMDGLMLVTIDGVTKTRYEHFYGSFPKFARLLRTWGEAGVVKLKTSTSPKMNNKGTTCMFVGYAKDRSHDSYLMWNVENNYVYSSRDVIWLQRMYFQKRADAAEIVDHIGPAPGNEAGESNPGNNDPDNPGNDGNDGDNNNNNANNNLTPVTEPETENPEPLTIVEETDPFPFIVAEQEAAVYEAGTVTVNEPAVEPGEPETVTTTTRSGRTVSAPARLVETMASGIDYGKISQAEKNYYSALIDLSCDDELNCANMDWCNTWCIGDAYEDYPVTEEFLKNDESDDSLSEMGNLGAALGGVFENTTELRPMKYGEALQSKDRLKWSKAVREEYDRMVEHKVFQPVPRKQVPPTAKIMTSTWAMKKKSDGTFRARVNGRGYEQIDGEH